MPLGKPFLNLLDLINFVSVNLCLNGLVLCEILLANASVSDTTFLYLLRALAVLACLKGLEVTILDLPIIVCPACLGFLNTGSRVGLDNISDL